ncbi:MAG TPA: M56 family metallopeptidase [Bryobacteraceae bacterium]|nr:M56 family metallopeptidase [Bryobacteraceae bacterium]
MIRELTNHLWQSTWFAFGAGLLILALRRNRASVRFWVWFGASMKFLLPFALLTSAGQFLHRADGNPTSVPVAVASTIYEISEPFPVRPGAPLAGSAHDWLTVTMLAIWACGLVAVCLVRLRECLRIRAVVRNSRWGRWPACPVDIRFSRSLLEPAVVGVFRPVLLIPEGIEGRLTAPQLAAVVAHELAHMQRRDNLFSAAHMMVEALFWFHPLVWWIGSRLVAERERACDEEVLHAGNEPREYAEAILNVCKAYFESSLACVSGVGGSDLRERIELIFSSRTLQNMTRAKKFLVASAAAAALLLPLAIGIVNVPAIRAQAQAEKPPTFEAASIKPMDAPSGGRRGPSGGDVRITAESGLVSARYVTGRGLIREAYRLTDRQIAGGPAWLDSDGFTVEAKAAGPASTTQLRRMLQGMLKERFHFTGHFETKEMPVYVLTVAKNGPKVRELKQGDPIPNRIGHRTATPGPAMIFHASMPDFAYFLSRFDRHVDRLVVDQTGLQGIYFFGMQWGDDEDFLTVMQEEFGLKLSSQKASVDILVIDHIEKPDAN